MKRKCEVCNRSINVNHLYNVEVSPHKHIIVCEECMDDKDYWEEDYYPLTEDYEFMDEEEKEGWDSLIEHWNKD